MVLTSLVLIDCKRNEKLQTAPELVPVTGQVFVVTRGAANIRLGEVTVYLCPLTRFSSLDLAGLFDKRLRELRDEFDHYKQVGDQREALVRDIKLNYQLLVNERDRLVDALPIMAILHERYERVSAELSRRDKDLDGYSDQLITIGANSYHECDEIADEASRLPRFLLDHAYEELIPKSQSCKTDADGRFRFQCPVSEEVVIFTKGQRVIPSGDTEFYNWFTRIQPKVDRTNEVLLTNKNLVGGSAPENLFSEWSGRTDRLQFEIPKSESRSLQKRKPLPHEPQWAEHGVFYLLQYTSVTTASGVVGLPPGTQVRESHRSNGNIIGVCGDVGCEIKLANATDNIAIANEAKSADYNAQSQVTQWQAQQVQIERAITDEENRKHDEVQQQIDEDYRRMHTLTGESRLNEPPHP